MASVDSSEPRQWNYSTLSVDLYEKCVSRIDVNDLVYLLSILSWDELGVYIMERAMTLVAVELREKGIRVARETYERDDRMEDATSGFRYNLSANSAMHTHWWVKENALQNWYMWSKHEQHPDGVFVFTLIDNNIKSDTIVLMYECDGHGKDSSHEMRKVVMKMWNSVDASRWDKRNSKRRENLSCFTVRSNLSSAIRDTREPNELKRGLAWLYRFMRSHIWCFLQIVESWKLSHMSFHRERPNSLPLNHNHVYDHHFFIGLFQVPSNTELTFVPIQEWLDKTKFKSPTDFKEFMKKGDESRHIREINDEPLPLISTNMADAKKNIPFFDKDIVRAWKAEVKMIKWTDKDVQCMSVQRVSVSKVIDWLTKKEFNPKINPSMTLLNGLWYLTDLRDIILFCKSYEHRFESLFAHTQPDQLRPQCSMIEVSKISWWDDAIATLIQNVMTAMETSVLSTFKSDSGWGKATYLKWTLLEKATGIKIDHLKTENQGGILLKIKQVLRDNPDALRNRTDKDSVNAWEKYNMQNSTLRSRYYNSLNKDLPALDAVVDKFLDRFSVPNAKLFFRLIRCNSILALRELARQMDSKRMDGQVMQYLRTFDICVQSEVNFIFDKVREDLDVFVDPAIVQALEQVPSEKMPDETDLLLHLSKLFISDAKLWGIVNAGLETKVNLTHFTESLEFVFGKRS